MYNSDRFLRYANTYLEEKIKEDVIAEVSERLAANSEIQLASTLKPTGEPRVSEADRMKPQVVVEKSDLKPVHQVPEAADAKPETDEKPDFKPRSSND
jgi:hypothetical protein